MTEQLTVIIMAAAAIGFVHTILGPDHYLPFVMLGRARGWSHLKLSLITVFCGIGHVLSSIVLGAVGIAMGIAVSDLEIIEGTRSELTSYLLIAFGLVYGAWGLRKGLLGEPHNHSHAHLDGLNHHHKHDHIATEHRHLHSDKAATRNLTTVWSLFIIFVLGPCEPLIPLLMFPAAEHSVFGIVIVSLVFGLVTVTTMTAVTLLLYSGFKIISTAWLERYVHAFAGFVIAFSGAAIAFLGL
ncbi:MAG: sulfite exporter TauE/SafE family protein [Acidobacteriota bacterium]